MTKILRKNRTNLASFLILGTIFFGYCLPSVLSAANYQLSLAKGTSELIIETYDKSSWTSTVDPVFGPNNWFEGNANITHAKSKITLKGWTTNTWQIYDWFISLFLPQYYTTEEIFIIQEILRTQGYNETTINANYTTSYGIWYGLRSVWNFTIDGYEENPSYTDGIIILQNPTLIETVLNDYNSLVDIFNNNIALTLAGYTFPNYTADDFLWQFALNGLAIAEPQSEYLTAIVNELGCENASASGSRLLFQRYGLRDYTVEIKYGSKGMISGVTVKDDSATIIFLITSSNSEWIFFLILIITAAIGIGSTVLIFVRKRKLKR